MRLLSRFVIFNGKRIERTRSFSIFFPMLSAYTSKQMKYILEFPVFRMLLMHNTVLEVLWCLKDKDFLFVLAANLSQFSPISTP
jgi:hypothetical protein